MGPRAGYQCIVVLMSTFCSRVPVCSGVVVDVFVPGYSGRLVLPGLRRDHINLIFNFV